MRQDGRKAGKSSERAEKVEGKAKDAKPSPKKKYSNKRKSQGKEDRVHPKAQNLRRSKGKEERKNKQGKKGKESPFPHQRFQTVTLQQIRIQN